MCAVCRCGGRGELARQADGDAQRGVHRGADGPHLGRPGRQADHRPARRQRAQGGHLQHPAVRAAELREGTEGERGVGGGESGARAGAGAGAEAGQSGRD